MSKGLRQRVALARALLSDPEVLFLDEPTAGLDPVAAREVHELIDGLRKQGVTIFLTTHRLEEAERLCDRVAILNTTLRTIGRPEELRDRLFARTLTVRTVAPLQEPDRVFAGLPAVTGWHQDGAASYVVAVSDPVVAAPGRDPSARGGRGRRAGAQRAAAHARGRLPRARRRPGDGAHVMSVNLRRVRAIARKELREFRHNRSLVIAMGIYPLIFTIQPLVAVIRLGREVSGSLAHEHVLLYMLGIPALVPVFIAAAAVASERQQGTLEPVLTTPITREEFLLGKALASLIPSLAVAYVLYLAFLVLVTLLAQPTIAAALIQGPDLLAQVLFTPLLAVWTIWVGMAVSTRSSDVRVAQQLGALVSLPPVFVVVLIALNVIPVSLALAVGSVVVLIVLDVLGWRITSRLFDRERLITGTR